MNFGLIALLLVITGFVSAAAKNDGPTYVYMFTLKDHDKLNRFIREGDDVEALSAWLENCIAVYTNRWQMHFEAMIHLRRPKSFALLLSRVDFSGPNQRDTDLVGLLGLALDRSNIEIADTLLDYDFQIQRSSWVALWCHRDNVYVPWDLDELKALISRHPDRAADLAPTYADMKPIGNANEALLLIELTRYCDTISGQPKFDPSKFLHSVLSNHCMNETDMTEVVRRLLEFGAEINEKVFDNLSRRHPGYVHLYMMLQNWTEEPIKEPVAD